MSTNAAEKQYEFDLASNESKSQRVANESLVISQRRPQSEDRERRVVLSDRDYEVLEFILEMKFASLDEVCAKFFQGSPVNQNVVGYWYAKKRLAQLEQAGFLESTKKFSETKRFYFAKQKAYSAVTNLFPEKTIPRATGSIDGRTVAHDYLLLRLRLELEKRHQAHFWISDRSLKIQTGILAQLSEAYSPDGIYKSLQGSAVAFELEISLKAKSRYQDKVKRYVQWIREHRNDQTAFKTVHYVATNEAVKKHLDNYTAIYPDLFKVEMVGEYFTGNVGLK